MNRYAAFPHGTCIACLTLFCMVGEMTRVVNSGMCRVRGLAKRKRQAEIACLMAMFSFYFVRCWEILKASVRMTFRIMTAESM